LRVCRSERPLLEDIVELEPDLKAFVAETDVDSDECAIPGIEAQPESGAAFQIPEVQLASSQEDLAGVHEQRAVAAGEDCPAVFAVKHQAVVTGEPEWTKAAEIVRSTGHRLKIEWDGLTLAVIGHPGMGAQRNDARPIKKSHILL
jgi:hypothetical protein